MEIRSATRLGLSRLVIYEVSPGEALDVAGATGEPGATGVLVGRALYEGRVDLASALAAFTNPS